MNNKFTVNDLNLYYGDFHALKNINLDIKEKEITAFIGPSGCGKSTFLKTLARINKPKAGEIFINKKDIKKINEKNIAKEVAFLPQGPVCPSGLTVRELVAFG